MLNDSPPHLSNDTGGAVLAAVGHNLSEALSRDDPASSSGISLEHGNVSLSHPLNSTLHAANHKEAAAAGAAIAIFYGILVRLSISPLACNWAFQSQSYGCANLTAVYLKPAALQDSLPSDSLE